MLDQGDDNDDGRGSSMYMDDISSLDSDDLNRLLGYHWRMLFHTLGF